MPPSIRRLVTGALVACAVALPGVARAQSLPPAVVGYPAGYFTGAVRAWSFVGCHDGVIQDRVPIEPVVFGRVACLRGRVTYGQTATTASGWGGWMDLAITDVASGLRFDPILITSIENDARWSLEGGPCPVGTRCTFGDPGVSWALNFPTPERPWYSGAVARFPFPFEQVGYDLSSLRLEELRLGIVYTPGGFGTGRQDVSGVRITLTAIPEPSTVVLAGLGLVGVAGLTYRRRTTRG